MSHSQKRCMIGLYALGVMVLLTFALAIYAIGV